MFLMIINSLMDFRRSWRKYIALGLGYLLITSYLFVPGLAYLFNRLLIVSKTGVLLNRDIFKIFLNYKNALGIFSLMILAVVFILIELGTLTVIAHKKYYSKPILITEAMATTFHVLPRILGYGFLLLTLQFLVVIPLVNLPVKPLIFNQIKVPTYFIENIMVYNLIKVVYGGVVFLLAYFLLRCIFVFHEILLTGKSTWQAIRSSLKLTKKLQKAIIFKILMLNLILFGLLTGILAIISFLLTGLNTDANYQINQILTTLSGFLLWIYTLLIFPVNILFLTRLYYEVKRKDGAIYKDFLRPIRWPLMSRAECYLRDQLKPRRYLSAFLVILSLIVSFYMGHTLNQDLLYKGRDIAVAAHRGKIGNSPENSLSAIALALDLGVDVIELDVQLTKDYVVVLHHDLNLRKMAGISKRVSEMTYSELLELDIGSGISIDYMNERIPRLEDVITFIDGRALILIDIKAYGYEAEMAKLIVEILEEKNAVEASYIQSFNYKVLSEIRLLNSDIRIGQIMYYAIGNLDLLDVDFYTVQKDMLSQEFAKKARQMDRGIWVWTLNREAEIKKALQFDIDGIITANAELVQEILGSNVPLEEVVSIHDDETNK
ncbi:glycerophosphoryl diester phosphodiesterase membrane domain-containing protein [Petrocella sp. FN5]|uniref:glycerophosphoryl diester phosphodiesterase membrane domain-containing protein n=1 Tax=Petrocella sp. FN5 TaxID=3032002 RepID=UPI0023DC1EAD|nr:glycerophosphoryl diester phosphodiesterase membrane domain-containing protein [Petrocella sp. FN5]MDF1617185.1 glycerophosphoryl diester phosphodiesterase membrane domain-containing protein [Petrocella sp. FN5]